jgi:hypothetical protein
MAIRCSELYPDREPGRSVLHAVFIAQIRT